MRAIRLLYFIYVCVGPRQKRRTQNIQHRTQSAIEHRVCVYLVDDGFARCVYSVNYERVGLATCVPMCSCVCYPPFSGNDLLAADDVYVCEAHRQHTSHSDKKKLPKLKCNQINAPHIKRTEFFLSLSFKHKFIHSSALSGTCGWTTSFAICHNNTAQETMLLTTQPPTLMSLTPHSPKTISS